ncbi:MULTISPECIES: isoleucine--tRNA ligase [Fervidicoccus]|uniref:Isoleucine--tRNA ligase n=1 Tax=Fervidicoccus fontis (strain DSM 19380 / JCM 18336 / VKM B-2539 / Kam940) TaxID=1163730 RepID=I0A1W5_FERFK|nr:isoleucine--tRNA ligase [Fervidicoccus fontis]AFH42972.1 Isoleucyl-tRNA synthetase [Fervidicoccus fontis Kam940]
MSWNLISNYDPLKIEEIVIRYWTENGIRKKVLKEVWDSREGSEIFSFLEGPPTTNGYMHAGHARGRIYKDVMIRYHMIKGFRVWAQGGWDTQGLPVELEVEKKFKVKSKKEIEEKIGVEKFIEECKKSVDHYISEWISDNERLAVWLDYEDAYQTRNPKYLETVWSFVKNAYEEGLLYKSYSVVPRCPRCGTALSNHELSLGSEIVKDPSLYFKVKSLDGDFYFAVWTTTPWTIIANRALAVNPQSDYVLVEIKGEKLLIAEPLLNSLLSKLQVKDAKITAKYKGSELVGKRYVHPLSEEVPKNSNCSPPECTVVSADYVTMTEGTGIVHTAPAHGPEDFETAKKYGLEVWTPLKDNGYFGEDAGIFSGMWFKDASKAVVEALKEKGLVLHYEEIEHEYPHCWRCGTPLIYYPTSQWFIKTTAIVNRMREYLKNVKFRPSWGYNRMDAWVEASRDWCISRERYWGTPLPIWICPKCGHIEVFGSIEELSKAAGVDVKDPHKPYIDQLHIKCPKCGEEMKREPFVMDVWADSGVAHTAALKQLNKQHLHKYIFPYSFALEPPEQVRGWFYTLLITSTVLNDSSPFKMLGMHGLILDAEGQKMSKSKGNVVFAREALKKHGADQLRLFMCYRNSPWQDIRYVDKEISEIGSKLRVFYNVVKFFISYAELDKWNASAIEEDMKNITNVDKWILTKEESVMKSVYESIENFDLHSASKALFDFLVEDVSRRYIVAVRPRVWTEENTKDKRAAYATIFTLLKHSIPLIGIFTPFIAEYIYQTVWRKVGIEPKESVMLEVAKPLPKDYLDNTAFENVEEAMKVIDTIVSYRGERGIKRRMPLKKIVILWSNEIKEKEEYISLISTMANITSVEFVARPPEKFVKELQAIGGKSKIYIIEEIDKETYELGLAKEVIRRIQIMRKENNLEYSDKVNVKYYTDSEELESAIIKHIDYIKNETRAVEISKESISEGKRFEIEEYVIVLKIEKINSQ